MEVHQARMIQGAEDGPRGLCDHRFELAGSHAFCPSWARSFRPLENSELRHRQCLGEVAV